MNPQLKAWLLEGTELPQSMDLQTLLDDDPQAQELMADLAWVDAMAAELPELEPPSELDAVILGRLNQTPQAPAMPPSVQAAPSVAAPANRWWRWAAGLTAVAAAALLVLAILPTTDPTGNPEDWTPRGEVGAGPGVDLSLAVQRPDGTVERFRRTDVYQAGQTLLFRYDAHASGWLHLVRVDDTGVDLIHTERVRSGQGDLRTPQGLVGYELEHGESTAVFVLIRHTRRLQAGDLKDALSVEVDPSKVCAAVRGIGGRCAAEMIEAVP